MSRARRVWPVVAALALAACGSESSPGGDGIAVRDVWARTTPAGTSVGAAYLRVEADSDDSLTGVTVSPAVAEEAQIHMTMDGAGGTSMMHAVQALELPADAEVVLEPGGYHVMLIELVEPLAAGDEFELTLEFAQAPDATVTVEVRDDAP